MMKPAAAVCVAWFSVEVIFVRGQTAFGGVPMQMGALPLQSNLGSLAQGILPQAPGPLQGSGFSGLGGAFPGGGGGGLGGSFPGGVQAGAGSFGATPGAMQPGLASSGQTGLPTLNLLGSSMSQGGSVTPQNIQQMQAQAVQSPTLDAMCPGKARSATNVGEDCWAKIWTAGGCNAGNVPKYEDWHQMQSMEVLVGDVVQWANLPDERHQQGCYGAKGPPQNEPAPTSISNGMGLSGGGSISGGMGLGMAAPNGSPLSGGMGLGIANQGPAPPPAVTQKVMSALQSPELASVCPGLSGSSTSVGEACWKRIWKHVGCLESTAPSYEEWHNTQNFEVLVADAAQWASLPSATHRQTCYGANSEL